MNQATMPTVPSPSAGPRDGFQTGRRARLVVEDSRDVASASHRLARGAVVAQAFGNFYALTSSADADMVRSVNVLKGRPPEQVGSIVTTPLRIARLYDWFRLPEGLSRHVVMAVMDAFLAAGPFGFRGPAAADVPDHLTSMDAGVRTAQVISPGFACPSNAFLAAALGELGSNLLYVTSANRSRWLSGAVDEPAHYRADALAAEFGGDPRFVLLEHIDEAAARARYPLHDPMSTTILAFHRTGGVDRAGRTCLVVERHGSLPVEAVRRVLDVLELGMVLGPGASVRLRQRDYAAGLDPMSRPRGGSP